MAEHPIQGMLGVSMDKIREMVDVDTIIGTPINVLEGVVIIPVSKVTFGFGSGGSDFPSKTNKDLFGGGAGAGVSIQPIAFLVISGGEVQLLPMQSDAGTTVDRVIETAPEIIETIKGLFKSKKPK